MAEYRGDGGVPKRWRSNKAMEEYQPSKHAGSDPEAFLYGQFWPLRPGCRQNRHGSYMPDPTSCIGFPFFSFFFSKEGMDHIVLNRPGFDLDGLVRVWPKTSGLEASWSAGIEPVSGRTQPARYKFPHVQTPFRSSTNVPDNIVQN